MVFDVDRNGDLGGFGIYQSSGHIGGEHMEITLRGAPPRGCTYVFDLRLVHPDARVGAQAGRSVASDEEIGLR